MSRAWTLAALLAVYGLLLGIVWRIGESGTQTLLGVLVAAIVFASWWRGGATLASLGLAPSKWREGWRVAIGVSLAGAAALATAGIALGSASLAAARFTWLGDYALGILGQQLLMQGFFARGVASLAADLASAPRRFVVIAATALAFAALHAPNPGLVAGVAAAGVFWVAHFTAHRNLPAVLASHFVLGAAAMAALGPGPLWNLRVGAGALELMGR